LTIGTLTHRVRAQADAARHRERRTQTLLALSKELAAAPTSDFVAATILRHVSQVMDARAVVLVADRDGKLKTKDAGGAGLDAKEQSVAEWAHQHGQAAGAGTGTLPAAAGTYVPMKTSRGSVGVLGVFPEAGVAWSGGQRQLIDAFASQAAVAVERAILAEEAREAWERVEAEFLRNTLLSGVSHELRTPLAAITGAASSLTDVGSGLSESDKREMVETIWGEAERMERLIKNLLDMTRLESGGLVMHKEWHSLEEVVGSALRHLDRRLTGREVKIDLPGDLPLVHMDGLGVEQVLANLVDNAVEYTPPDKPIEIHARVEGSEAVVEVSDRGPGLPAGTEQRVFQKFFRAGPAQTRRGIGLGLAICKGIVEAHGGRIEAFNRPGGGACFRLALPLENPPKVDASA
jgi:two-component system sensor histidine kinase KdpD